MPYADNKIDAYRRCYRRLIRAQEFETERIIINSYLYIDFVQMSLFYVNFRFVGIFQAPVIKGKPNIFFVVDIIDYLTPRALTCIYNLGCNVAATRDIAAYIRTVVTHFVKWEFIFWCKFAIKHQALYHPSCTASQ